MERRLVSRLNWDPRELYWKVSVQDIIKQPMVFTVFWRLARDYYVLTWEGNRVQIFSRDRMESLHNNSINFGNGCGE